jgi:NTE family protein
LEPNGARVLSYLLFERAYCRHLMRLGFADATAQRERILNFLGYDSPLARHSGGKHPKKRVTVYASGQA